VPGPPDGPGVQPPFAAPPQEGRTTRVWLGLGAAGLAVLLCCGGGLAAFIGLALTGVESVNERAHAAVAKYLQDLGAGKYPDAYKLLCDDIRNQQSLSDFAARMSERPKVTDYVLHRAKIINNGEIDVPADVTYTDSTSGQVTYRLVTDQDTGEVEVCGTSG
jgi:hypothetical protein